MMLEKYEEAIQDCDQALLGDPSLWRVTNRKGRAHMRLGQLDEADHCFTRVLELTSPEPRTGSRPVSFENGDSYETLEQGQSTFVYRAVLTDSSMNHSQLVWMQKTIYGSCLRADRFLKKWRAQ